MRGNLNSILSLLEEENRVAIIAYGSVSDLSSDESVCQSEDVTAVVAMIKLLVHLHFPILG